MDKKDWKTPCPYCEEIMGPPDLVDVGVGMVQCGPYHCYACGASQIGPEEAPDATPEEKRTGFYRNKISPCANTVEGQLVDHKAALSAYRIGRLDKKELPR